MKNSKIFENAFGYGIGEVFPLLEEGLQQDILQRIPIDGGEFAGGFGESIGYNFTSLDDRPSKQSIHNDKCEYYFC